MDGAHDLGGKPGFGNLDRRQEQNFPNHWEKKVFGLTLSCGMLGNWNLDESRSAREQMDGGHYLASSYYEHWLHGLEWLLVDKGLVSETELREGKPEVGKRFQPVPPEHIAGILIKGAPVDMKPENEPGYNLGDSVMTIDESRPHHTRLPGYARGKKGAVIQYHGCHVFPDVHATQGNKVPEHLYTVEFSGAELWGEDSEPGVSVCVDVFESYISGRG